MLQAPHYLNPSLVTPHTCVTTPLSTPNVEQSHARPLRKRLATEKQACTPLEGTQHFTQHFWAQKYSTTCCKCKAKKQFSLQK